MELVSDTVRVRFNPQGGMLDDVTFLTSSGPLRPMHRAPWVGTADAVDERGEPLPIGLANMAGDFFCAPFSTSDVFGGAPHGPTANGNWRLPSESARVAGVTNTSRATFVLDEPVMGARVEKYLTLRAGEPVVYQQHVFHGGEGALPVAHHAMLRVRRGHARLSFSAKAFGATPDTPLESHPATGRSLLRYPQRFDSLSNVALADGRHVSLDCYPALDAHEDLLLLAEAPGHAFGWTAACAPADGFLFVAVKNAQQLPFTMLWMSHGGRYRAPFNGRHTGVLGVEEGCTAFHYGHRASCADNELTRAGYQTALELRRDTSLVVSCAFACVPCPAGWSRVANVVPGDGALTVRGDDGMQLSIPFNVSFPSTAGRYPGAAWQPFS